MRPRSRHEFWMRRAITEAKEAEARSSRPFGCVIVDPDDVMIATGQGTGHDHAPLRHSEYTAIQVAAHSRGLLEGCTLYSTHEPCHMCAGAILHAHLSEVVWGSYREDLPQLFRYYDVETERILYDSSHRPKVTGGVLRDECVHLFDGELSMLANERAGY